MRKLLKKWFGRKSALSDRDRIRNQIVAEVTYATALAGFLYHAFNHGHGVRITVGVDGDECGVAILANAKEPLVEYLANWACAEKIRKENRLDEFDKGGGGQTRWEQENGSGEYPPGTNTGDVTQDIDYIP